MKRIILAGSLVLITLMASAQKTEYKSLTDAFMSGTSLRGNRGPSGVEWLGDGSNYSFTKREGRNQQIWTYSIEDETEELIFSSDDFCESDLTMVGASAMALGRLSVPKPGPPTALAKVTK